MRWILQTYGDGRDALILDDQRVVGSLVERDGACHVEILFAPKDIKFRGTYDAAVSFVRSAEAWINRQRQ